MLKHANYNIENGLKSLKIGFEAIFNALINKEIEVYQTKFPLSYNIVNSGLELCYNRDEIYREYDKGYKSNILGVIIKNTKIVVIFEIDRTLFYRMS